MHRGTFTDAHLALPFAEEWIEAWNSHDLERILGHYDDDVIFRSPYVAAFGERSGTLRGKAELHDYFARAIARAPDLRFELDNVLVGVASIAVSYRGVAGVPAVEVMSGPDGGPANEVHCHYLHPGQPAGGDNGG